MNKLKKNIVTQAVIVLVFVVLSFAYFYPLLEGKVLPQMDTNHAIGVAHEVNTYQNQYDRSPGWTNSLFGGMPTYQIGSPKKKNIFTPILRALNKSVLPYATVSTLFLYMLGFYILLLAFKVDKWLSLVGAIAFALSSYNIIIIIAGHVTKTYAIAFMPVVIAGFILLYDKKYWLGSIVALLGLGLQVTTTHIQIVYYTGLTVGLYLIFKFFWALKDKELKNFAKSTGFAAVVIFLVILPNIPTLWQAYEISKYSIRGKSELNTAKEQGSGLDKDYALAWSYGVDESFTLLIPNVKGGGSNFILENEKVKDEASEEFQQVTYFIYQNFGKVMSTYHGDQPFTSGPVYLGAIIFFLFILGMFIVKNKIKWWVLAATILALMLSWGKNFELLTNPFFNSFPFYNKFRTVSMILVIVSVTIPFLSFLTLKQIIEDKNTLKNNLKPIWYSLGITAGLLIIPSFFGFISKEENLFFDNLMKSLAGQESIVKNYINDLTGYRKDIYVADAFRSFIFIALGAGLILAFLKVKDLKKYMFIGLLGFLIMIDLWAVDRRYLSADNFQKKSEAKKVFMPTPVDEIIQKDPDKYYRVLNLTTNTFNDAFTSYFHKSIGGYHGAKLRRYQDVVDKYLGMYNQAIINTLQDTSGNVNALMKQTSVLNMLNTKYIIYSPEQFPIVNTNAFGNAWFVDNYKFVETAQDEIDALGTENLQRTAIINKKKFDVSKLPELSYSGDTTKYIQLTKYEPDRLEFEVNATSESFVVFSDIYYPEGWNATIDDKPSNIYQTNYILRGLVIPAGKHTIKFEFKPDAIYVANNIAIVGGVLVILMLLGSGFMLYKNSKKKEEKDEK